MSKNFVDIGKTSDRAGMAMAEYAIGTVTAADVAGVMWWLVNQDRSRNGMKALLSKIFSAPGM